MSDKLVTRTISMHRRWVAYDAAIAMLLPLGMLGMIISLL